MFAVVLKREMKKRKMREVSRTCSIPASTLFGWAQGINPTIGQLPLIYRLASHFGLTFEELIFNKKLTSPNEIVSSSTYSDENQNCYRVVVEKLKK